MMTSLRHRRSLLTCLAVTGAALTLVVGIGVVPSASARPGAPSPGQAVTSSWSRSGTERADMAASRSAAPTSWQGYLCNRSRYSLARLRQGSHSYAVVVLQSALKMLGWYPKRVDGDFGPITARGVRNFQRWAGIVVDGYVGPQTWGALQWYVCD